MLIKDLRGFNSTSEKPKLSFLCGSHGKKHANTCFFDEINPYGIYEMRCGA